MCNDKSRDIYPSHLGRIDVNALSHGDSTGLTSVISPYAKVYDKGFFVSDPNEPDFYLNDIKELNLKFIKDSLYEYKTKLKREKDISKKEYLERESLLSLIDKKTNKIQIGSRKTPVIKHADNGRIVIPPRNPFIKVMYVRDKDGLYRSIETGRVVVSASSTNAITPTRFLLPIRKDRVLTSDGLLINKNTGNIIIPRRNTNIL